MEGKINALTDCADTLQQISDYMGQKHPDRQWMYEPQRAYWNKASRAQAEGVPVVWHSIGTTPEIFHAMDVAPICLDVLATTMAGSRNGVAKYVDLAQQYIPDHICGFNKTPIGMVIAGDIPKPNALVYTSTPCDSARIAFPMLAKYAGITDFCIDTPFAENEQGYTYIANELSQMITFLEQSTNQKLDWDTLAKVIENSNRAFELIAQIAELRKNVPCPLPNRLLVMNGVFAALVGTPELVQFLETQYEIGRAKLAKGEGHLPEERIRIAWIQNPIAFDLGILDWMEKEFGAIVTMDAFGFQKAVPINSKSDKTEVLKGLAERCLRIPMIHGTSGPTEHWLDIVTEIIRDYKCDAAIFAGHVGCKHTWAVGKLIKDMISDKFGIPTLVFDIDALDPRYTSPQVIRERIGDFLGDLR
ncbi:MAG: 2-hydroxyacyl-CoA dehydratase family protein [Chloroflexota bacterium]|nr:2-hydroxyacyl-CoA dehydratase family protein [Chloroflexota bacterium]